MDPFTKRLWQVIGDGLLCLGLTLGHDLGMFNALAEVSSKEKPATAAAVAEKANLKERYVKEWLCQMACGDIIEVDESGEHFWIAEERLPVLAPATPSKMLVFQSHVAMMAGVYSEIKEVFKKDGPLGTDNTKYKGFHKHLGDISQAMHKKYLFSDFLPLTGMKDALAEGGLQVLDVGCGNGLHATEFAIHFPKSFFTGIDISKDAVEGANQRKAAVEGGVSNLEFVQMDGEKQREDWSEKFDFVTDFNACHDLLRPDLCLKEINRVLKPGGTFCLLEVDSTSNVCNDKSGIRSLFMYGVSVFHCLPVGSNAPDALCLGAMWGRDRAAKMLKDAGFSKVEILPTPFYEGSVLYKCAK